jgi:catalase
MRTDGNYGREKNYGPNTFGGPVQTGDPTWAPLEVHGPAGNQAAERRRSGDDDFAQAGALYRLMSAEERQRVVDRLAFGLALLSRDDIIERCIGYFRKADADYGERLAAAVKQRRTKVLMERTVVA